MQGAEGFKNARRGTTFAAQSAGTAAGLVHAKPQLQFLTNYFCVFN